MGSRARRDWISQPAVIPVDRPLGATSLRVAIQVVSRAVVEPLSVSDSGPDRCSGCSSGAVVYVRDVASAERLSGSHGWPGGPTETAHETVERVHTPLTVSPGMSPEPPAAGAPVVSEP